MTGWTWEYIDENMTLPRLYEMSEYWAEHPPLHLLVAAVVGAKPKKQETQENPFDLLGDLAAAGVKMEDPKHG